MAHWAKIRAHAELGERVSALRAFEHYRRRLPDDLGVDPSPEIREFHLQILREQ